MLDHTHLVQAKCDLIGSFDREPLGLILFLAYPIPCLKVTEFDAQNIVLCGLCESGLYQGSVPLLGLMINKVPHLHCCVNTWFENWWAGQPPVVTNLDALPITNRPYRSLKDEVSCRQQTTPHKGWVST